MTTLGRGLKFIAQSGITFIFWLFLWLIRLLLQVGMSLLRRLLNLMAMAVEAAITGPRKYIERLSSEWTQRFISMGISLELIDTAHRVSRFLATSTIVLGWVITATLVVVIVRVVFGFLI